MATETIRQVTDDMDGSVGEVEERRFAVGDIGYCIDLTEVNWKELLHLLEPYIARARVDRRRRRTDTPQQAELRASIRSWAQEQGLDVGARGRIPFEVVEAYDKAHQRRKRA
jgi:hypothetical protein